MPKMLLALLLGAALAQAENIRGTETVADAVRGCLAATDAVPAPAARVAEPSADGAGAVDLMMLGIEEAVRQPLGQPSRGGPAKQAPRGYLVAAAEEGTPWDITGALGFTLTDGNSDTIQLTIGAEAKREWPKWKLGMKLGIIYGETDGEQTASEWLFLERLERKLSERATIFQDLLLEHDEEEDLRYRIQFTVGYNRRLVKKEKFEMWGNVGGGVLHESFFDEDQTEGVAQLGINFTWQITKNLKYEQVLTFYPSLSEGGEFRMYWESRFTTPIGDRFDLRLTILDRYDSNPQPGIEKNDLTVAIALAVKFTKPPPPPAP